MLSDDAADLETVASHFDSAVAPGDAEARDEEVVVGERRFEPRLRNGQAALQAPVSRLVTSQFWGGVINAPAASDAVAGLEAIEDETTVVRPFDPAQDGQALFILNRAVQMAMADDDVLRRWEAYRRRESASSRTCGR